MQNAFEVAQRQKILQCESLTVTLGQRCILNDITFDLCAGEFVGLLGRNGQGKSTLLRALAGLCQYQARRIQVAAPLGFLFQSRALISASDVFENILCGSLSDQPVWLSCFYFSKKQRIKACEIMDSLGLYELRYQKVKSLSAGQQQLVAVARLLMRSPAVIFADEPLTGLDEHAGKKVMDVLASLARRGVGVLCVLHDFEVVKKYVTRALVLSEGKLVYDGDSDTAVTFLR